MVDLTSERVYPLKEIPAVASLVRGGKKIHFSTLLRWVVKGCKSPDGQVVRLEAVRLGRAWMTSLQAVRRFSERLTPQFDGQPATPRTPTARGRALARATRELELAGI